MKTTPFEGFPYPEDNDYGDGALDLQVLAEAIDAKMAAMLAALSYMGRRETCVVTNSADSGAIGAGSGSFATFDTVLYNNGFAMIGPNNAIPVPIVPGSYLGGLSINCQLVGAVTAHSQRQLLLVNNIPTGPTHADLFPVTYADTCYDSGVAGGDFLTCQGTFDFQAIPTNPYGSWLYNFRHENLASNMVVKAGAIAWFTRISDLGS